MAAWAVIALFVAIIPLALIGSLRDAKGDPGNLTEVTYALPQDLPPIQITDATVEWGLDDWINTSQSHLSGGAALGDLDGDGVRSTSSSLVSKPAQSSIATTAPSDRSPCGRHRGAALKGQLSRS
jgi:hypothetical protein